MIAYDPLQRALYRPSRGLAYPVLVLAERQLFGRHEYQIQSPAGPETQWVMQHRLTFTPATEGA